MEKWQQSEEEAEKRKHFRVCSVKCEVPRLIQLHFEIFTFTLQFHLTR